MGLRKLIDLDFLDDFGLGLAMDVETTVHRANTRSGACDDSTEVCAPFINMMPDESHGEEPSPLDFD
jgi:hypothetical protein